MVEIIPLGKQAWYADGVRVMRSRDSKHELTTVKHLDINNTSIGPDYVINFLLKEVCAKQCPAFAQCFPEAILPNGWFNTTPPGIKGAQIHTDNCVLVETFIPDAEFRKE